MLDTLRKDLQYGLRSLLKKPTFALVSILSLGIGIGANAAIFTIVNAVFLNPLPVKDISQLVEIFTIDTSTLTASNLTMTPSSYLNYQDFENQNSSFTGLAASMSPIPMTRGGLAEPEQIPVSLVTANYFDVLGVPAYHGRSFLPHEDDQIGGNNLVVLSYSLWMNRFGGNPAIIDQTVTLNSQPYTITGVAPPNFKGTALLAQPDVLWMPISMRSQVLSGMAKDLVELRRMRWLNVVGRLRPNVTLDQAQSDMTTIAARLEKEYPKDNQGRTVRLAYLSESALGINQRHQFVQAGTVLMTIVGIVLLIACANITNLLLARAVEREKEFGIRVALGAGRAQILRQLLTESMLLSFLGGAVGLILAYWGRNILWSFRPPYLSINSVALSLDARVIGFTVLISLLTGLLVGTAPALRVFKPNLTEIIGAGTRGGTPARNRTRLRSFLVVSEIALAVVALFGAGLFLRSMQKAQESDLGIEPTKLFMIGFDLSTRRYDVERGQQFLRDAVDRTSSVPGVASAAVASAPAIGNAIAATVFKEGEEESPAHHGKLVTLNIVSPTYFETMRIPLTVGRLLTDSDREDTTPVAVINEAAARLVWPGEEAVGRRFRYRGNPKEFTVVGVVKNSVVTAVGETPKPVGYFPVRQGYNAATFLLVRTAGDPEPVLGSVRGEIQRLDPQLGLTNIKTITELLDEGLWAPRMGAALLALFGFIALGLASIGIYGVMAYSVMQRSSELGVRMALGATTPQILALVFKQGMLLAFVGMAVGVLLALVFSTAATKLLYGITPMDPATLVVVVSVLILISALACLIPAWRASRIDPLEVLRRQ